MIKGRKRATTSVVARLTHRLGLPLPGSPLGYSSPSVLSCTEQAHIPQERGGALPGLCPVVGSEVGGEVMMVVVVLKGE